MANRKEFELNRLLLKPKLNSKSHN